MRFQTPCSCEFYFSVIKRGFCLLYFLCSLVKNDRVFFFFFFFPAFRKLRGLVLLKQEQRSQNCSSKSVLVHCMHRKIVLQAPMLLEPSQRNSFPPRALLLECM